jgi:allantoicase
LAQKLFALLDMHGEKPAVKAEQWKLSRVIYKAIFYKDCAWSCVVQESGVERGVLCPGKRAKNLGKDWESRRRMVFRDLVQIRGGRPKKNKAKWKVRCPFDYCVDRWILNTRRLKLYIQ